MYCLGFLILKKKWVFRHWKTHFFFRIKAERVIQSITYKNAPKHILMYKSKEQKNTNLFDCIDLGHFERQ